VVRSSSWFLCDVFPSFCSDCVRVWGSMDGWRKMRRDGAKERKDKASEAVRRKASSERRLEFLSSFHLIVQ